MASWQVVMSADNSERLDSFLQRRLHEFNVTATGYDDGQPLTAHITGPRGETIAGLSGHTWGGCCEVVSLWVDERERGRGLGTALLAAAEAEAKRRGCSQVTLSTHTFQAPAFYEKLGYVRVGMVADYPRGHAKLHLAKPLP
jgi:GNAT superfamily N-acetyltransferase